MVHGWESFDECKGFFMSTGLGIYPHKMLPDLVLEGLVHERKHCYRKGYWSEYGHHLLSEGSVVGDSSTVSINNRELLSILGPQTRKMVEASGTSVLVIAPERDGCVDVGKIGQLIHVLGPTAKLMVLRDCGHLGGPSNSPPQFLVPTYSIFEESTKVTGPFLTSSSSSPAVMQARL